MDTLRASVLRDRKPQIGIVLGSGLGALADRIEGAEALPYSDIPGFPVSTAPGHKGRFVFGTIGDKEVVLMDGRVHLYEGYTPQQVVMPIRLIRQRRYSPGSACRGPDAADRPHFQFGPLSSAG